MDNTDSAQLDILDWLTEATSEETVNKLLMAAGGTKIWIPEKTRRPCRLVRIVGRDAAEKIRDAVGSGPLHLPMGQKRGPASRATKVIRMTEQGRNAREIATVVGVCERTVWRVRARHRASQAPETTE